MRAWLAEMALEQGPGISEVRRLEGNTGLVVVGPIILSPEHLGPAAAAAFTLLQGVSRLVIDLRGCVGGVPESVALFVSHLVGDEPVHLQDLVHRDGTVTSSYTTPTVSPRLPADVPVVVLTSARTFSGGEELAYDLQSLGRAPGRRRDDRRRGAPARGVRPHSAPPAARADRALGQRGDRHQLGGHRGRARTSRARPTRRSAEHSAKHSVPGDGARVGQRGDLVEHHAQPGRVVGARRASRRRTAGPGRPGLGRPAPRPARPAASRCRTISATRSSACIT